MLVPICVTIFVILAFCFITYGHSVRQDALRNERHVFLDLETYSCRPNAAILAIGAVCVNLLGEEISRIKILVSMPDGLRHGHVEPATVAWWEEQSDEAKRLTFEDVGRLELADALAQYYAWYKDLGAVEGVWGNGATFDCSILRTAYTTISGDFPAGCPWDFWQEQDCRTVVTLGRLAKLPNFKKNTRFIGTPHNCVDDAAHQARYTLATIRGLM